MKVCFISRSAYPLFNPSCEAVFGGAEVDLFLIGKELSKDPKYQVSFLVGDFGQDTIEHFESVDVYKSYTFSEPKFLQMLKLIIKVCMIRADVFVQESASGGTGVIAIVCALLGKKFVYRTASEIDCNGKFIASSFVEGKLFKIGLKLASRVVVQNAENQSQLKQTTSVSSVVIKNGINVSSDIDFSNEGAVLWVARSEELKQPFLFLELARFCPNTKFVMVCSKANFNSVNMERLHKEASDISNLTLLEYVPYAEIWKKFKDSMLFVNTSTYEGFPNTFVQAASFGSAIFSLNVNPDNFIEDNKCGFFANGSMDQMKMHLKEVVGDNTALSNLRKNAYEYSKKNHDMSAIILKYQALFEEMHTV